MTRQGRWRLGAMVATLVLGSSAAQAQSEICSNTNFSTFFLTGCAGSFSGTLNGSAAELAALSAAFGGEYSYAGSSIDADFGPFMDNPQVAFNGTISFDEPEMGIFVLGLVSAGQHSYYRFNTRRRIGGLGFDSTEGVATTPQGNPWPLDYAVLYRATPVPEPATQLLLASGALALLGWARRRRGA
jgi:hypothetical protein